MAKGYFSLLNYKIFTELWYSSYSKIDFFKVNSSKKLYNKIIKINLTK